MKPEKRKITCAQHGCRKEVFCELHNGATDHLGERWYTCLEHMTPIMAFLVDRSLLWGEQDQHIVVKEVLL